ncbi:hypothetical protein ACRQ5Q_22440 [Bradyrhizobium sp. PMVTL-01]|uniref:hypothetical protein n=1 Tax=Bradyrhizobium sp. PMVTL-01 TaxID=3434999 RepID=UPI003F7017BB
MTKGGKHRWGDKVDYPLAHKSERECRNGCGVVKVHRHETEGGKDIHWVEYWRNGEMIPGGMRPTCRKIEEGA